MIHSIDNETRQQKTYVAARAIDLAVATSVLVWFHLDNTRRSLTRSRLCYTIVVSYVSQ